MQFITLLLIPHIIVWILTRSRRAYRWLMITALLTVQLISILPLLILGIVVLKQPQSVATVGLLPYRVGESPRPLNEMHSRESEWPGRDYVRQCGLPIVAPFAGVVTRGGIGIKDSWGNTYMYIKSGNGRYEMLIMHSDFSLSAGEKFVAGQTIGKTNTHGYSSECHEHISLRVDGKTADPEDYRGAVMVAAISGNASYPLRISWYDPSLGGTNCDSDCTTMVSGDKVASWLGGRGGVYAAACPRSDGWHHGKRFVLDGTVYECRDTGGWINCYQPGQYDPALKRQADMAYCWVDLLNNSSYGYGNLAYNWGWVQ